jgi:tetratricopeptide (TPR) repeat protein
VALERDVAIGLANVCSALGHARALQGRDSEALALIEEAIVRWDASGRVANRSRHRWLLAAAHLLGNRPDDARKAAEEALELARRHEERGNEAEALRVLGECAAAGARPDLTIARQSLEQALAWGKRSACAPSSLTATSASASSIAVRISASRPRSISPPRRRCTARWA